MSVSERRSEELIVLCEFLGVKVNRMEAGII